MRNINKNLKPGQRVFYNDKGPVVRWLSDISHGFGKLRACDVIFFDGEKLHYPYSLKKLMKGNPGFGLDMLSASLLVNKHRRSLTHAFDSRWFYTENGLQLFCSVRYAQNFRKLKFTDWSQLKF
jgi:hypothetical protein